MTHRDRLKAAALLSAGAALLLCAATAWATSNGEGDLITRFDARLRPTRLPRSAPAPVTVNVSGDIRSASGDTASLPQLREVKVGINRAGRLFDRGLPVCRTSAIQPATESMARRVCGGSIVGSGHVTVLVQLPGQPRFFVRARLLAFNGPHRDGQTVILAQIYARNPPGTFVLTFTVKRRPGIFGTILSTRLPGGAREWAYLTHFDISLHRVYRYQGRRRSFVSAACSAPRGLRSVLFPFARAVYSFDDGRSFAMSVAKVCRVAG